MILSLWYAILLGIGIIGFIIIIVICTRLYPNYSILRRTISGLGHPDYRSAKLFNPTMFIMGFILFPFPFYLIQALPAHWTTIIGIIAFICNPIGLILLGIFPEHKETAHVIAGGLCMGGSIIANIFLLYPILISDLSKIIVVITIIVLLNCIPLAIAARKTMGTYVPDQPIAKLIYNLNLWEWSQFLLLQLWIIALYINLLFL
jgi:hypothetical membrane protein